MVDKSINISQLIKGDYESNNDQIKKFGEDFSINSNGLNIYNNSPKRTENSEINYILGDNIRNNINCKEFQQPLVKEMSLSMLVSSSTQTEVQNEEDLQAKDNIDKQQIENSWDKNFIRSKTQVININDFNDEKFDDINNPFEDSLYSITDNYLCSLCISLLLNPIVTVCGHNFCQLCFLNYVDKSNKNDLKCPNCRTPIPYDSCNQEAAIDYDSNLNHKIKTNFPQEYIKQYNLKECELKILEITEKNTFKLRIRVGNTHKILENPLKSTSRPDLFCKHGYTCYVQVTNLNELLSFECIKSLKLVSPYSASSFIEKVVFKLHPTYKISEREVRKEPFAFSSCGWGFFTIPITVFLKKAIC